MVGDDIKDLERFFYRYINFDDRDNTNRTLILGIGNYLMGDEGIGVHAIHYLGKKQLPENVDIVDGGTGSFDLMPLISSYKRVIMIDATMDEQPVGTVKVLYPKFAKDFPRTLSSHDVGLKDMIDALEFNGELPEISLITVTIGEIVPMTTILSDEVRASLKNVYIALIELLK
ncbi:MAG: hydrogenase maturation protease [Deltaproteobacteria bacterium]